MTQISGVRPMAVAGQFYPGEKAELTVQVDSLLAEARADLPAFTGKPRMLVLPHAGYVYSGAVAAHGFAALEGYDYDTVIVVAVSHTAYFDGIAVYDGEGYQTPFGVVPINRGVVAELKAFDERFRSVPEAETKEHSIEVMVPFLQRAMTQPFTFVSIILSGDNTDDTALLARALEEVVDENTLVVASSDLSHYPAYQDAVVVDARTVDAILTGDPTQLTRTIDELSAVDRNGIETYACGEKAIYAIMTLAKALGVDNITLLNKANSGDVDAGDLSRVVGYAAVVFSSDSFAVAQKQNAGAVVDVPFTGNEVLKNDERQEALGIARITLNQYLTTGKAPEFAPEQAVFYQKLGAFVTLNKAEQLRGCIGSFEPTLPLWKVIREMAIAAATEDPRFTEVTPDELDEIEIELSILGPRRRISDPGEIQLGVHGVYVKKGNRNGTYLPQVATDNGWDLETFMTSLCRDKAGIGADDWKTGAAEIYVYDAQVFGEFEEGL